MSKKKAIIFFMTLAIVLGVGAWFYNNAKQEQREKDKIEAYKNEITMALNSFHEKTDKTEKIELFRQLQDSQYIYLNEDAKYQEITDLYENSLNQMEQSFIDFYNEEFQKVLEDSENSDRMQINEKIDSLNHLLDEIKSDAVLKDTDVTIFENQINSSVETYVINLADMTNSYYEEKIMENEIEDVTGVEDKDLLNHKIETLTGISKEIDTDEFIKDEKREEFKKEIEEEISVFENRVAEIDIEIAKKEEAEKKAKEQQKQQQSSSTSNQTSTTTTKPQPSNRIWTQEVDGVVYTAPQNVADLYYAGHGMQLWVSYIGKPSYNEDDPFELDYAVVEWLDHTTGIVYDEYGKEVVVGTIPEYKGSLDLNY